jgi:hypothetical protein
MADRRGMADRQIPPDRTAQPGYGEPIPYTGRAYPPRSANVAAAAAAVNLVLGVWLILAPMVLDHERGSPPYWNDLAVGWAVLLLSVTRMAMPVALARLGWLVAFIGLWLVAAPFVLGYGAATTAATVNDVVVGLAVASLALLGTRTGMQAARLGPGADRPEPPDTRGGTTPDGRR